MVIRSTARLGLALAFGASTAALAQETAPAAPAEVNASAATEGGEIIVTARRRDERLIDAPVAITAISGRTLEAYGVTTFTDMATLVPGMLAGKAGAGSGVSMFLRGVGTSALSAGFDQSVSFVVDGMPMSRGREISISQYDVQRVEVLKGPQALFFGKNATAGLVTLTTNNPRDQFEAGLKVGYGFEGEDKYAEGYISGPLSETLLARFAFRASDSRGSLTNTAALTSLDPLGQVQRRNSKYRGGGETLSGRTTIVWNPSSDFSLQAKLGYTDRQDGGSTDILERVCGAGRTAPLPADPFGTGGYPASPNAGCTIDGRADNVTLPTEVASADYRYARDGRMYAHLKSGYAILTGTLTTDNFDLTSISSFYRFQQKDLNNVTGEGYPATFTQLADFRQYAEELRVQSKWDSAINILAGGFFSSSKFIFNTDSYFFPFPISPVTNSFVSFKRDNGFKGKSLSFFGDVTAELTDQIEATVGARWSRETRNSFQQALPGHLFLQAAFPPNLRLEDRYRENDFSPQVTLRYKPSRDLTLYAAYKEGFKSGGFNLSQTLTAGATADAGRYGAERTRGGEFGIRGILLDGTLSLNTTAYYYDYLDLQVQTFDPTTISLRATNAGKLRVKGIEADFNWQLGKFALRGDAAYNNAEYKNYVGECYGGQTIAAGCNLLPGPTGAFTSQDYDGRTPPKAPRFAGRIGASYETPVLASGWTLGLSGDLTYTSKYNFTDALRPDAIQSAFAKIDASLNLSSPDDRWTVSLIGRNLTDKLVAMTASDLPFTGGTGTGTVGPGVLADMSAYVSEPREIYVQVGFKF